MGWCLGNWARTCARSAKSFFPLFACLCVALRVLGVGRELAPAVVRQHAVHPGQGNAVAQLASIFSFRPGMTNTALWTAPASAVSSAAVRPAACCKRDSATRISCDAGRAARWRGHKNLFAAYTPWAWNDPARERFALGSIQPPAATRRPARYATHRPCGPRRVPCALRQYCLNL